MEEMVSQSPSNVKGVFFVSCVVIQDWRDGECEKTNLDRERGQAKCQTICLATDFSIPDSDCLNLGFVLLEY